MALVCSRFVEISWNKSAGIAWTTARKFESSSRSLNKLIARNSWQCWTREARGAPSCARRWANNACCWPEAVAASPERGMSGCSVRP